MSTETSKAHVLVVNVLSASHVQAQVWRLMVFDDIQAYPVGALAPRRKREHHVCMICIALFANMVLSLSLSLF